MRYVLHGGTSRNALRSMYAGGLSQDVHTSQRDRMALRSPAYQLALPGLSRVEDGFTQMAAAGIEQRGAVYTRRPVVDFILDLTGYTADRRRIGRRCL